MKTIRLSLPLLLSAAALLLPALAFADPVVADSVPAVIEGATPPVAIPVEEVAVDDANPLVSGLNTVWIDRKSVV